MKNIMIILFFGLIVSCATSSLPSWVNYEPENKGDFLILSGGFYSSASAIKSTKNNSKTMAINRAYHKAMKGKVWDSLKQFVNTFISENVNNNRQKIELTKKVKDSIVNYKINEKLFKEKKNKYFKDKMYYTLIFIPYDEIKNLTEEIIIKHFNSFILENNIDIIDFENELHTKISNYQLK